MGHLILTGLSENIRCSLQNYTEIYNILNLCKGKLSLCGGSLIDITQKIPYVGMKFNLYFHSCDKLYVSKIINELEQTYRIYTYKDRIIVVLPNIYFIELSNVIYKDKEELLRNVGSTYIRHGYNLTDGYFSTFNAALSYITKISLLDVFLDRSNIQSKNMIFMFHGDNKNLTKETNKLHPVYNLEKKFICDLNQIAYCNGDKQIGLMQNTDFTEFTLFIGKKYNKLDPRIRFGKDYIPIIIGISDDRYVAFSNIKKQYNVNNDIFRILCDSWLREEVLDAKNRLLLQYS